jgi:disulfide oxidoreductase YuzD
MSTVTKIKWKPEPESHDYPAALSYLNLIFDDKLAKEYENKLKQAVITEFKAKDIFRASSLSLLGPENYHVKENIKKIKNKENLVPILLVRHAALGKTIIADGYHRLCAVYSFSEDALIPCKIV